MLKSLVKIKSNNLDFSQKINGLLTEVEVPEHIQKDIVNLLKNIVSD